MSKIIKKVAQVYGVSPKEVKEEIEEAVAIAMQDPESRKFWESVCPNGVDADKVIEVLAYYIS